MALKIKIKDLEDGVKEIEVENLEGFLEGIKTPRYAVGFITCKGPNSKYKSIHATIIIDRENKYSTEIRCDRYKGGWHCKREDEEDESKLEECIQRPRKNKPNDRIE